MNLSSVPEAHRLLSGRSLLSLLTRLRERSGDEETSTLAGHLLGDLRRSDAPGVRNRLFKVSTFLLVSLQIASK